MKPKGYMLFSVLLLVAMLLGACAPKATEQPAASNNQPAAPGNQPAAGKEITLEYWVFSDYGTGAAGELQKTFIAEFTAKHPGVKINMTPKGDEELNNGMIAGAASGNLPDIFMNGDHWGAKLDELHVLTNLKDRWDAMPEEYRKQINPDMLAKLTSKDGKTLYAFPYTGAASFVYRNLDVLKASGIDPAAGIKDWDDWKAQIEKIGKAGYYGNANYNPFFYNILSLYAGAATKDEWGIDWEKKQTLINPDKYAKMMQFILDTKPYRTDVGNDDQAAVDLFISGKLAFLNSGPWTDVPLKAAKEAGKLNYDYVLTPGLEAGQYGGITGIEIIGLAPNENIDLAWEFVTYICDEPQMTRWAKLLSRYNSNLKTLEQIDTPLMNITVEAAKHAFIIQPPLFVHAYPSKYFQVWMDNVAAIDEGKMTLEEGVSKLTTDLNAEIAAEE